MTNFVLYTALPLMVAGAIIGGFVVHHVDKEKEWQCFLNAPIPMPKPQPTINLGETK